VTKTLTALVLFVFASSHALGASRAQTDKFAGIHSVAILSAVEDKLIIRKGLEQGERQVEQWPIAVWGIDEFVAARAKETLSKRFEIKNISYSRTALDAITALGVPSKALPQAIEVDAYVVVFGRLEIVHSEPRALTALNNLVFGTRTDYETEQAYLTIYVIDAKTRRIIVRKQGPAPSGPFVLDRPDYVVGQAVSDMRKDQLKIDFKTMLDNAIPVILKQVNMIDEVPPPSVATPPTP
jgi:hypothetical protein